MDKAYRRLRALVRFMPAGQDKSDLQELLTQAERVITLEAELQAIKKRNSVLQDMLWRKEGRVKDVQQLTGALECSKYVLRKAHQTIQEQKTTIGWLCRRLQRYRGKLADYEKKELKAISNELEERPQGS